MIGSARVPPFLQSPDSEPWRQWAGGVVRQYFLEKTPDRDRPRFTGSMFERLEGGGDRSGVEHRFTPADLVAVSLLSVAVHPEAALQLLDTQAAELSGLLLEVPTGVELARAGDDVIGLGSAADKLWSQLRTFRNVGPTRASKLLARKRPHLLPVWDSEIKALLGFPDSKDYWRASRDLLGPADSARNTFLKAARADAGVGAEVTVIRVFDVLCWMWQKGNTDPPPA